MLLLCSHFAVVDVVIDPIISSRLRSHQVEGVKFMYEVYQLSRVMAAAQLMPSQCVMGMKSEGQGCILADEMCVLLPFLAKAF